MVKTMVRVQVHDLQIKLKMKQYPQFDAPFSSRGAYEFLEGIYKDSVEVSSHRFLPFVLRYKKSKKFTEKNLATNKRYRWKIRSLVETAHKDTLIYKLYSAMLNRKYEEKLDELNLTQLPTAYRQGIGSSNISAAKEVFDIVVAQDDAWIIKGDFKGFFDNINHKILKKQLIVVLGVKTLPNDWFSVFKSVTAYRTIAADSIPDSMKSNAKDSLMYIKQESELGKYINSGVLKVSHVHRVGIPQGTAISAVLANVYMLNFDRLVNQLIMPFDGVYRRYSDDFVIVLKKHVEFQTVNQLLNQIRRLAKKKVALELEHDKTKLLFYQKLSNQIYRADLDGNIKPSTFDYLGFAYDGRAVSIRSKSFYKQHYRAKHALKMIARLESVPEIKHSGKFVQHADVVERYLRYLANDHHKNIHTYATYAKKSAQIFVTNSDYSGVVILKQINQDVRFRQSYLKKMRLKYDE